MRTFSTEFCDRRDVVVRHLGDTAVRTVPEGRSTTSTIPPVNRVGRSADASSAPPPAFRQIVPTPMRSTERYASRIAYSDLRPNEATGQPRCRHRCQPVRRNAEVVLAALLAPLILVTFLPFYVRSPSVLTHFLLLSASLSPLLSYP